MNLENVMKFLSLFLLGFAVIFPFIWLWHSFTYDIARQQVKSMGRKGNYDYTVKHELFGWVVVRKK